MPKIPANSVETLPAEPRTEGAHGMHKGREAAWHAKNAQPAVVKPVPPPPPASGRYTDILAALRSSEVGLSRRGSAILASHLLVERGDLPANTKDGKRVLMTSEDVKSWALTFKKRSPLLWSAVVRGDIGSFSTFLGRYGIEHESFADTETSVGRILRSEEAQSGFPKLQPMPLERLMKEYNEAIAQVENGDATA